MLLAPFEQFGLLKVWVSLNLVDGRLNLGTASNKLATVRSQA